MKLKILIYQNYPKGKLTLLVYEDVWQQRLKQCTAMT